MKRSNYLIHALFLICLALWLALVGFDSVNGQTISKSIECTVGETDKDGRRAIHCPEFDYLVTAWPRELDLYKSKGEVVRVIIDGERIRVLVPTCQERIRKAFLQHADGSTRGNVDAITPADCAGLPKKDREGFTKEP